ncbi:hypothetical protein Pint_31114 [Pistacia integerrima]|uniref:Uncharacterized protein n=1 Tax=Pistacia integerrima TaxID=434235 RepID=A0ACC0XS33_9ROSI|nr:hypothetical protein Pint_31114 [Pistacia integerrima]
MCVISCANPCFPYCSVALLASDAAEQPHHALIRAIQPAILWP